MRTKWSDTFYVPSGTRYTVEIDDSYGPATRLITIDFRDSRRDQQFLLLETLDESDWEHLKAKIDALLRRNDD